MSSVVYFWSRRDDQCVNENCRVPAAPPNSNTAVNMKVLDTDRFAGTDGSLTVKHPARMVNPTRTSQSTAGGAERISSTEAVTTPMPTMITAV